MPKISHSALRRNFRDLLATPLCVETASVFDPMSARIAADLGFEVGILAARSPPCRCWRLPILR